jgi:hypothetical protein
VTLEPWLRVQPRRCETLRPKESVRKKKKTEEAEARGGAKAAGTGNEMEAGAKEKEAAEAASNEV